MGGAAHGRPAKLAPPPRRGDGAHRRSLLQRRELAGDSFRLPVEEVANCHCEVIVTLPDPEDDASPLDAAKRKRGGA